MDLSGKKFTESHEWISADGNLVRLGITDFAQGELGDIVFVELPSQGDEVAKGDTLCTVESVKAVNDVYSPVSGTVKEVNIGLEDNPEKVNESPFDEGWMVLMEISDSSELDELMDDSAYKKKCEEEG